MNYQLDAIYVWAASKGLPLAHASLAAQCVQFAELDPPREDEWLTGAELYGELAVQSGDPEHQALLGSVLVCRCVQFAETNPPRSLEYHELAMRSFDEVERSRDHRALSIEGFALSKLADLGFEDAGDRLNRVIGLLPPGEAEVLRETVRAFDAAPVAPANPAAEK